MDVFRERYMDSLTREHIKREIDKKVRQRNARLKKNKRGKLNMKIIQGDSYSAEWPPRMLDGGNDLMGRYHQRKNRFNKFVK